MTTITVPPSRSGLPGARDRRSAAPVRLTRRGRAALVVALLAVLLLAGFTLGAVSASHASGPPSTAVVVVRPGDTLWSIAARVSPHRDTRQVVAALLAANRLASASVQVGEQLVVPQ